MKPKTTIPLLIPGGQHVEYPADTVVALKPKQRQVITIGPLGEIFGMDHKKKGLRLQQFGKAQVQRVTLIEWSETQQRWFIQWAGSRELWKSHTFESSGVDPAKFNGVRCEQQVAEGVEPLILFVDYEDAVAAEVAVIQALQLLTGSV
jgi:hypothetical protein